MFEITFVGSPGNTICVCVTTASSLPFSDVTRVCQTIVRRPRCIATHSARTVVPTIAGPMKLVFDSIVVVIAPSRRFNDVAQPPSVSASAIIAPPCRIAGRVHISSRTFISAVTHSGVALTNLIPSSFANGSMSRLSCSIASMSVIMRSRAIASGPSIVPLYEIIKDPLSRSTRA